MGTREAYEARLGVQGMELKEIFDQKNRCHQIYGKAWWGWGVAGPPPASSTQGSGGSNPATHHPQRFEDPAQFMSKVVPAPELICLPEQQSAFRNPPGNLPPACLHPPSSSAVQNQNGGRAAGPSPGGPDQCGKAARCCQARKTSLALQSCAASPRELYAPLAPERALSGSAAHRKEGAAQRWLMADNLSNNPRPRERCSDAHFSSAPLGGRQGLLGKAVWAVSLCAP